MTTIGNRKMTWIIPSIGYFITREMKLGMLMKLSEGPALCGAIQAHLLKVVGK